MHNPATIAVTTASEEHSQYTVTGRQRQPSSNCLDGPVSTVKLAPGYSRSFLTLPEQRV